MASKRRIWQYKNVIEGEALVKHIKDREGHKASRTKAKKGVEAAVKALKAGAERRKSKPGSSKKNADANWASRMHKKVKFELSKRKAARDMKRYERAEEEKKGGARTRTMVSGLRSAGVSDKKIQRMRGRRN